MQPANFNESKRLLGTTPLFTTTSLPQTIAISDCIVKGIEEIVSEKMYTVYPNPTSDFIEIIFTDDYIGAIEVLNEAGQLILSQRGHGKANRINVRSLEKGMYIISKIVT